MVDVELPEQERIKYQKLLNELEKQTILESSIRVISYYKWQFGIECQTKEGDIWLITCGGNSDLIYKFNPFDGLDEWKYAEINYIEKVS